MKYVVFFSSSGLETPIILPETESHVSHVKDHWKIIAAGQCRFFVDSNNNLNVSCWGHSFTLGVKSRLEIDEELILRHNAFSD